MLLPTLLETANRKMSRDHGLGVTFAVCSSRLNRRKGFQRYTSYLRQSFFATKNCTVSRLKVWTSFWYPFAMRLLDFWSRINELLLIFGRLKWCTSPWWKQPGGPKQGSVVQIDFIFLSAVLTKESILFQSRVKFFLSCYWIHSLPQSLFSSSF